MSILLRTALFLGISVSTSTIASSGPASGVSVPDSVVCSQIRQYYKGFDSIEDDIEQAIIVCNPEALMENQMFVVVIQVQRASDLEWLSSTIMLSEDFVFDPEYVDTKPQLDSILGPQAMSSLERNSIVKLFR